MGVGGELETPSVIKTLHTLDQAHNTLSHQIRQLHASAKILAGDGHDQPLIALDHLLLCSFAKLHAFCEGSDVWRATCRRPLAVADASAQFLDGVFLDLLTAQKLLDVNGELAFLGCC